MTTNRQHLAMLDAGPYLPCSYLAMCEQREAFLRRHVGPSRFTYDCNKCSALPTCTEVGRQNRSEPPLTEAGYPSKE